MFILKTLHELLTPIYFDKAWTKTEFRFLRRVLMIPFPPRSKENDGSSGPDRFGISLGGNDTMKAF